MCVARRMMDLGQRQAIRDHRVSELLVPVHDDMSGVHQSRLGQMEVPQPSQMRAGVIRGGQRKTAAGPLHKRIVRPSGITMSSFVTLR